MAITLVVWLGFFWGKQRKEWTEEVALADGSKIEIERRLTLEKTYYDLGQAGLKPTFQWIRLPDGVIFETEDALIPLHLERGSPPIRWSLLAALVYCATFDQFNRPEPAYLQFDYSDQKWTYRTVDPTHFGKTVNLLVSDKGVSDGSRVGPTDKPALNSTSNRITPSYLKIDSSESLNTICAQTTHGGKN